MVIQNQLTVTTVRRGTKYTFYKLVLQNMNQNQQPFYQSQSRQKLTRADEKYVSSTVLTIYTKKAGFVFYRYVPDDSASNVKTMR